mmetsp:Transcript_20688/g.18104  ORF Transcript_20688/g.18104 Transcript_20688/m.18104 type:complete len:98 (-) Transcript_20688:107-400(-)
MLDQPDLYSSIKDFCLSILGIQSQFLLRQSLDKNHMSVCSKILIQMTAKCGYLPWHVKKTEGLPKNTMIIGADVFHRFDKKLNSCVGFCASIDPEMS